MDINHGSQFTNPIRVWTGDYRDCRDPDMVGLAAGLVRIIEAIVRDENSVLTVSGVVNGRHGLNDVALSLPRVINRQGIAKTLELPLSNEEETGLKRSAQLIHEAISSLDLEEQITLGKIPSARLLLEQKELV